MLTPEWFDGAADDILELYGQLDESILQDFVRRIIKSGGILTQTARWQAQSLQDGGMLYEDIIRAVASMTSASTAQVRTLFEDGGVEALKYDFSIYEAAGLSPLPLKQSPVAAQVLRAGMQKTAGHLRNLTMTTAAGTEQAYKNAARLAEMQVESGAFDYISAIRNAVRTAAQSGTTVLYPSGHTDDLDVAVRRAVLTGMSQTAAQVSLRYADDMGCDLVETTAHPGARWSHAIWQGRVFCRNGKRGKYPDFVSSTGYGSGDGLCGWNCRHSFFPYFEGLSTPAYPHTKLAEYAQKTVTYNGDTMTYYAATQKQRAMERAIRATKRELAGYYTGLQAEDEGIRNAMREEYTKTSVKLKGQEARLADFTDKAGVDRQREREQSLGFGRGPAQQARQSAEKHYRKWAQGIGADDAAPKTLAKYYQEKYNNSPAHELLAGYNKAVKRGDVSPLVGFEQYTRTAKDADAQIVGVTTANGVKIESYTTHFIDRLIGQTSTPHTGMRTGVSIADAKDALVRPMQISNPYAAEDGDLRQQFFGENASVVISLRDKKVIQTNPL
ncbi:phage minor capsid protein [Ethanoligenens harbinense]|uniref:Minor capsid 2 protein n=1 Tax=Ethanoligenens harbinense (strain DSM 18485 / JCM 12961 / CGMCC 1.5033 / YUAN-3) TaxID=663278 RepID=E6U602_ETHHY|nr:phage minor capsid protein [Ethanoligenens harbinense]ADU25681.1 minor capsid 2 protein [Ethanoligenens harbinense YUAN-3]AVQ94856.1 capsid protein [Ethanoligenens harbinense YUAN-3]AYF37547.1 capsid protein [Ethanoligenens harbinense]AYF40267.1 capsid protein [Ethanoligenens harbinense]QCN91102.1 capsid protein [Ethanoligenens harbinense]